MKMIAIDLGGTNVATAIVEDGRLFYKFSEKTIKKNEDDVIYQLSNCVFKMCEIAKLVPEDISGVGIAVPGWIDTENGIARSSPNLPLHECKMVRQIEKFTGISTKIENDANCAALGEQRFGSGQGCENMMMLTLGTGLGAGVVLNNRLLSGVGATELAHVVMKLGGLPCGCGRFGCTEQYTSAKALVRIATEKAKIHPESRLNEVKIGGREIFYLIEEKDKVAEAALEEYIGYVAEAILNFITIFGPMKIVIGGGVVYGGDAFFIPLRKKVNEISKKTIYIFTESEIVPASLLNDAGIYGAAALFL